MHMFYGNFTFLTLISYIIVIIDIFLDFSSSYMILFL